ACYASSGSKILLCTVEKTARAAKKTLTLGVLSVDNGVEQAVVDYNRASTEFRVELIEYATADDPTGVTGLNLALTSGQTPDLLDVYGTSVDVYARKGVLADLSVWMDDTVNRESILPVLLPLLENDGAIYALPRGFSVRTLFSTDALIGGRDSWSFADMLSLLDENPAVTQPLARMTAETGLRILQDAATAGCIDAVAGVCDFTLESFIGYLELLRCFPDTIPGEEDTDTLLREGRALCRYTPSMTVGQFMDLRGAYGDSLRTPGLPEIGNTVDFGHALSITAACSDSAAAWDFIKSYVTGTSYSPYGMWSIPILSDAYAAYIDETVSYYSRAQANNTYVSGAPIHVPDDADWVAWDTFLPSVTKASSIDNAVGAIVTEEVSAYLGGARTAEETAHVIDSRVKVLLAENA
ncbi:MAG: extracellular solute-binding protein, partial [Clostridiaceae bacterium]|nr:extracellular solute-binding protein [Clostridiaceae bacterium]